MATPGKKPALVVDIDVAPKKKPGLSGPGKAGAADPGDSDDVRGEAIARRLLRAFEAGDAPALNAALKSHYEHCRDSADEAEPEADDEDLGAGLFGGGGPKSEY